MPKEQKTTSTKASIDKDGYINIEDIIKLEDSEVRSEKRINWDEIAKKAGIIASIITAAGFLISILVLVVLIYAQIIDFSNRQADLNIQFTNRISQLEGKLDILIKTKNH